MSNNAILNTGGGGGLTNITETLITSSPYGTNNVEQLAVTGGSTNTHLLLTPKGTGAVAAGPIPDNSGADAGGTLGDYAISLVTQYERNAASGKAGASGARAVAIGARASATGSNAVAIGGGGGSGDFAAGSTGIGSVAVGNGAFSTGTLSVAVGPTNASGTASLASGWAGTADRFGQRRHTNTFSMGAPGSVDFRAASVTTDTTPTELFLDYANGGSVRFTVNNNTVLTGILTITGIKDDGTVAVYLRQVSIANIAGTTALVGSVNTIGTDTAASTSISVAADDTNDSLQILVTGTGTDTWRWCAQFSGVEIAKP